MALPVLPTKALGSSAFASDLVQQREALATSRKAAQSAKRRADEERRRLPQPSRRPKDNDPLLSSTRSRVSRGSRGHRPTGSTATVESSSTTHTAGRSFTVANINNGIIYLRPVIRPANQRSRPSLSSDIPFAYPQTPPSSASLDQKTPVLPHPSNEWQQSLYGSRTNTRTEFAHSPPPPTDVKTHQDISQKHPAASLALSPRVSPHVRSRSFSTADDRTVISHSTEPGTFKVVIERPPFGGARPKTADTSAFPILEVPIPHYRLGEPRFSARGTAILRSSTYTSAAGSDDLKSSLLTPQRATNSFLSSRPHSDVYSPIPPSLRNTMDRLPRQPSSEPTSARVSKLPIGPRIYDALTANPDDSAVVRFSPSGDILAATPSRLVAHITSPSFLNYELLSDFFLTFRSFLCPRDLVSYLISRLNWAVNRQDDFGRIVRVRTFVALRHWILNYFVDDFVPAYRLRVYFCELVNNLHDELRARDDGGAGDIKILGELKKCWRRTCALYWESGDVLGQDAADEPLLPGGHPQSQTSVDEPLYNPQLPSTPPRQTSRSVKVETPETYANKHSDWSQRVRHTPQNSFSTPYNPSHESGAPVPQSPASERSMQVLSCSIPMRGLNKPEINSDMPLYPHPVPHPVPAGPSRFAASTSQGSSTRKPNHEGHVHKRSGSFSDALRDNRAPLSIPKNVPTNIALTAIARMPGSLVRGGIFQPSSPYVDVKNGNLRHMKSHLELMSYDPSASDLQLRGVHSNNPGMRKLFGSVRRALSSKQASASAPQLQGSHPGASVTQLSTAGTVSTMSGGVHKRRATRSRPHVRVDALASVVSESFKHAVMEQMKNDQHLSSVPSLSGFEFNFDKHRSDSNEEPTLMLKDEDPRSHSGITAGSKSIPIMDDTAAPPVPLMSGALPSPHSEDVPMIANAIDIQRNASIDAQILDGQIPTTNHPNHPSSLTRRTTIRTSLQPSHISPRRSVSAGREYVPSSQRHGSLIKSTLQAASLRRHSSFSGIGRSHEVPSMATFQTMSSGKDPFFLDHQSSDAAPGPARMLRRRPGGDLRAAGNINDLEQPQRPHSTGTVSNRTHSIANSVILRSDRYGDNEEDETNSQKTKPISLVDTHSSQPNLRPSFELEVAKLAALPDDADDDGGIESTLMKLEGRYEKKSPPLQRNSPDLPNHAGTPEVYQPLGAPIEASSPSYLPSEDYSSQPQSYAKSDVFYRPLAPPYAEGQEMYRLSGEAFNSRAPAVHSTVESDDSYSSIPLLDRAPISAKPAPLNMNTAQNPEEATPVASTRSSLEYVTKSDIIKRIPKDGTLPRSPIPHESFVVGDEGGASDRGSSRGTGSESNSNGVGSIYDDEATTTSATEKTILPTHPMRHPPTPPLTANRLKDSLPRVDTTVFDRGLPTPGLTPTSRLTNQAFGHASQPTEHSIELQELKKETGPTTSSHLPFILAYDSETLAQQFTIVEKDALDEIDWRELIELRWKQSSPAIRDWVQYLRTQEARGVDVVIARFNLVVKWAVSQIVLTENIEERAKCIVKLIHIATHARRIRNYATMYQLTIGLLSNDISRLRKTWSLVPALEMRTLRELEALVQPLRNFNDLRVEMETSTGETGCIPFIGIYTRDLIYNAQKSAFIDAPPVDGERLVNFERHHTAATIVKSLLRLLEASSKYNFQAEPTIVSKCLWLAALSDEEITQRSRNYE